MPLSPDFQKVKANFIKQYGAKKGEQLFHAWVNKNKLDDTKPMPKHLSKKERKISEDYGKVDFKEVKEEFYSKGFIATTHIDKLGDMIPKETLDSWAEQLNSTSNLDAKPVSIHHDRDDLTLAGIGTKASVEKLEDGHYGLFVDTHHNKSHENFEDTKYQIDNNFLTHYSIEYNTNDNATTHKSNIDGQWVRVIDPETQLLGYGLASPRTVVNKEAKIIEADYKELFHIDDKESFPGKLGSGERFRACVAKMQGKVKDPKAVCASIGRKKFGKGKFQKMAAAGKEIDCGYGFISETELKEIEQEVNKMKEQKEEKTEEAAAEEKTEEESEKTETEKPEEGKEFLKEVKQEIKKEMKEKLKAEILAELKETKPENAPLNNPGAKIENKEVVETKEQVEFKELHTEFKEKVLNHNKNKSENKAIPITEQYRLAAKMESQLKEKGLIVPDGQDYKETSGNSFEIKENRIELKDVMVETDPAGTTTTDYPSILANYEQSPARFNDVYGPVIVNHLNDQKVTWNRLTKENMTNMSAIRIRARTARNTTAGTYGYGSTPDWDQNVAIKKLNLHFVTSYVEVQLEDEAIEFAKAPGGIGDAYAQEIKFSTLDLMDYLNQSGIYGTGDGTSETAPLGLDGGLIRTSGNLYGKDVTATGFTTLAAAGKDAMASAKITITKMREMWTKCVINGARTENLAFFTSYVQYRFIYALIQDMQRIVPTSARVGFEGTPELDGIPIYPDPDLDDAGMTDDLFCLDTSATKIAIKKAPTYVEFGKVTLHRRGIIWLMWNLYSEAPNRNYHINGLATS